MGDPGRGALPGSERRQSGLAGRAGRVPQTEGGSGADRRQSLEFGNGVPQGADPAPARLRQKRALFFRRGNPQRDLRVGCPAGTRRSHLRYTESRRHGTVGRYRLPLHRLRRRIPRRMVFGVGHAFGGRPAAGGLRDGIAARRRLGAGTGTYPPVAQVRQLPESAARAALRRHLDTGGHHAAQHSAQLAGAAAAAGERPGGPAYHLQARRRNAGRRLGLL